MKIRWLLLTAVVVVAVVAAMIVGWQRLFPVGAITTPAATPAASPDAARPGTTAPVQDGPTLASYVEELGYQPLKIPRDHWGPGTIVAFDEHGAEKIVWFNSQCLKLSTPPLDSAPEEGMDVEVADSSLPNTTLDRSRGAKADVSLEKALGPDVDLGAAFDDQRLRRVAITINKARQFVTSTGSVSAKAKRLAAGSQDCANDLVRTGHFIIYDALVISDGNFQFYGADNTLLKLDAGLLSRIKATPNLTAALTGSTTVPISQARIVGYKLLAVDDVAHGLGASAFKFRKVDPAEIRRLKGEPAAAPAAEPGVSGARP